MDANSGRVYLDHNATSLLRPAARSALELALDGSLGNPASIHAEGRAARQVVERAREQVAELAGTSPREVVFTSGGSEAIAAAVRGVCDRAPDSLRRILIPQIEHSAVLEAGKQAIRRGFVTVPVPCDADGRVDVERFLMHLGPGVALAVLQWANNETGVVQPVEEIGRACRERGVPFLVDAVQAAGKLKLEPRRIHADLMAISAHKIGGPQGVGALLVREGIVLAPLIGGGAQERRRRGGTPGVAAIAGFGAACEETRSDLRDEPRRLLQLRAKLETRLREAIPEIRFHAQASPRLPNTVNFAIPEIPGEVLVIALDLAGFAVSTGSACASGAVEPSHVIQAMGFDEHEARGAVRISLGWSTTAADVERFLAAFPAVVNRARSSLPILPNR